MPLYALRSSSAHLEPNLAMIHVFFVCECVKSWKAWRVGECLWTGMNEAKLQPFKLCCNKSSKKYGDWDKCDGEKEWNERYGLGLREWMCQFGVVRSFWVEGRIRSNQNTISRELLDLGLNGSKIKIATRGCVTGDIREFGTDVKDADDLLNWELSRTIGWRVLRVRIMCQFSEIWENLKNPAIQMTPCRPWLAPVLKHF